MSLPRVEPSATAVRSDESPKRRLDPAPRKRLRRRYSGFLAFADWTMSALHLARPVVLVSGFWRSGTTWMQECLAESLDAKTVFEPLSTKSPRRDRMLRAAGIQDLALREALIPAPAAPDDRIWAYLDLAFYARIGDYYSLRCRTTASESLRRHIVVKDVRLQFNLTGVHARYGIPVVHVRRHPAAVIASFRKANWKWSFDTIRLVEVLPEQAALSAYDTDMVSRLSAYWAVTERFVDRSIADRDWATVVSYERVLREPVVVLDELCRFIGHEQQRVPNYSSPSKTSAQYLNPHFVARPSEWREILTAAEIERIRSIVAALYPEFRFDDHE